jgi:hypothetical protein
MDSRVGRSTTSADSLPFIAGLSVVPTESCVVVVSFSVFVSVWFASTTFGLHLFYGGGYCRCVPSNIFCLFFLALLCSQVLQFSLFRPCQSQWSPSEHGVSWVGCFASSRVFFLACVGRSTKNHRPFIISLYDDICCAYFDDVPNCCSLGGCRYMPLVGLVGLCGRVVRQSCWTCAW